ncbi:DRMBL-domain-containing protein [Xylariaceae sp. FL0594]|nr:DRMBL-domain-containing protein [Xylariaceae sp. FL0594]
MPTKSITPRRPPRQSKLSFQPASAAQKTSNGKKNVSAGSNGNIMSFFKKIDVEEGLFVADVQAAAAEIEEPSALKTESIYDDNTSDTTTTTTTASKRRKLSHGTDGALPSVAESNEFDRADAEKPRSVPARGKPARKKRGRGPFLADSDSEDDTSSSTSVKGPPAPTTIQPETAIHKPDISINPPPPNLPVDESCPEPDAPDFFDDQFKDLEDVEGMFGDEEGEYEDGEEFRERRFMQELEAEAQTCPICNTSLGGITSDQATVHVNACLDGNPLPLPPPPPPPPQPDVEVDVEVPEMSKRFARAAVPRAGQANPITLGGGSGSGSGTAFSRLMSSHAEDSAWASAAASEHASRGKPAYTRTCPFYKIMPGLSVCVDAFRYGAVQGCAAYFLSHFHSDHYVGLSASWSHGPIYCSRVTGSLVRNQLKTAARYVKELDFDVTVEIPGTQGVMVTMIPANHCPGSSLFLFEKKMAGTKGGRAQRILHCGDFRACPAHVTHPLLKPDVFDAVSGKARQQKIDICYLDTTYLNPRYSFPLQEDVIRACADFCKALSDDPRTAEEVFDRGRGEKGSTTVSSFFPKEGSTSSKDDKTTTKKNQEPEYNNGNNNRLLVVCGTYSIGKERICKAIAQALKTKIYAPPNKMKIMVQLAVEDAELRALLTTDPLEAQVHMQALMEIRADTLQEYADAYKGVFARVVGFRPSGWNFTSSSSSSGKSVQANISPSTVPTASILHGNGEGGGWRPSFGKKDLVPQRGSTRQAMCFGVPYSEHSSFRELALFLLALRIEKVVPTVNVGSESSRRRMKAWTDRWVAERRRGGCVSVVVEGEKEGGKEMEMEMEMWEAKEGQVQVQVRSFMVTTEYRVTDVKGVRAHREMEMEAK